MGGGTRSQPSGEAEAPEGNQGCLFLTAPVLCRTGKDGYVQIDGGAAVHGQSRGRSIMVNTKGSVYLGEPPPLLQRL